MEWDDSNDKIMDINDSELTAHPIFLEPKAQLIDQHIKKLLTNKEKVRISTH